MTEAGMNKQAVRLRTLLSPASGDSRPALPVGSLKEAGEAVDRFWAKRGKVVPTERWTSQSRPRGERGVA